MRFQPMAAEDVATALARVAIHSPANGTVEIGGPEQFGLDEFIRHALAEYQDPRGDHDPRSGYYGIQVSERTLVPGNGARLGETRFDNWLAQSTKQAPKPALQTA